MVKRLLKAFFGCFPMVKRPLKAFLGCFPIVKQLLKAFFGCFLMVKRLLKIFSDAIPCRMRQKEANADVMWCYPKLIVKERQSAG